MILSKVISSIIQKGRLIIKIVGMGKLDTRTCYLIAPFGIDSNPPENSRGVYSKGTSKNNNFFFGVINNNSKAYKGELRFFSVDALKSEQAFIYLQNNGVIQLNGDDDFLVRFSALESAFNSFKQTYNTHTHAVSGSITATPSQTTSASVAGAKVENLKCS